MFSSKVLKHVRRINPSIRSVVGTAAKTLPENATIEKTINNVTLLGRVGSDPVKKGAENNPLVMFSLATHNNYRHESGEFAQKTDWHRICVFKPSLRDLVFMHLKKGQRIHISGRISYGSIKEDSNYRPTASIIAEEIIFFQSLNSNKEDF